MTTTNKKVYPVFVKEDSADGMLRQLLEDEFCRDIICCRGGSDVRFALHAKVDFFLFLIIHFFYVIWLSCSCDIKQTDLSVS